IFAGSRALRAGSARLRRCLNSHAIGHGLMFLLLTARNSSDFIDPAQPPARCHAFAHSVATALVYLLPRLRGGGPASSDGGMSSAAIRLFFLDKMSRSALWMRIRA